MSNLFFMIDFMQIGKYNFIYFLFKLKAVLKHSVDFCTMLIGVEGAKTPAGAAGQVRPRRRFSAEEAHRPPRGKRSTWNGNQHSSLTKPS
jgi:hypothetical protein